MCDIGVLQLVDALETLLLRTEQDSTEEIVIKTESNDGPVIVIREEQDIIQRQGALCRAAEALARSGGVVSVPVRSHSYSVARIHQASA